MRNSSESLVISLCRPIQLNGQIAYITWCVSEIGITASHVHGKLQDRWRVESLLTSAISVHRQLFFTDSKFRIGRNEWPDYVITSWSSIVRVRDINDTNHHFSSIRRKKFACSSKLINIVLYTYKMDVHVERYISSVNSRTLTDNDNFAGSACVIYRFTYKD